MSSGLAKGLRRALGALLLLTVGAWIVPNAWVLLEASDHVFEAVEDVPAREVALVLGASVRGDGTPSAVVEDRLEAALELYRSGKVQRILVSGADHGRHYDEASTMSRWLVRERVPAADVLSDGLGLRTLDSVVRARSVYGVRSAAICTQDFHVGRAVFLARRAGLDAVGLVSDRREYDDRVRAWLRESLARPLALLDALSLPPSPSPSPP